MGYCQTSVHFTKLSHVVLISHTGAAASVHLVISFILRLLGKWKWKVHWHDNTTGVRWMWRWMIFWCDLSSNMKWNLFSESPLGIILYFHHTTKKKKKKSVMIFWLYANKWFLFFSSLCLYVQTKALGHIAITLLETHFISTHISIF